MAMPLLLLPDDRILQVYLSLIFHSIGLVIPLFFFTGYSLDVFTHVPFIEILC